MTTGALLELETAPFCQGSAVARARGAHGGEERSKAGLRAPAGGLPLPLSCLTGGDQLLG